MKHMSYKQACYILLGCIMGLSIGVITLSYQLNNRDKDLRAVQEELTLVRDDLAIERSLSESLDRQIEYLISRVKSSESALQREKTANRASRSRPATHTHRIAPSQDINLAALRKCENSGRYTSKRSDYYRGAYQFDQRTWDGVARRHAPSWSGVDPASANPSIQDQFARWLYSERGRQPWPTCGKYL